MFISHHHKFIFIKTKKTAGSSIEKILLDKIKEDFVFGGMPYENIQPIGVSRDLEHIGYQYLSKKFPYEWKNYYKFCVERNPWDKVVSRYHWYSSALPKKSGKNFDDFVLGKKRYFFRNDWPLYADKTPVVDKVIRYENLHTEFKEVCTLLNIEYNEELKVTKLKSQFRKNNSYRTYYNELTKEAVKTAYRQTVDYFNYTF